jgi:hypothetical protein
VTNYCQHFTVTMGWDYVELRPLVGIPSVHKMTQEWKWSSGGMILTQKHQMSWKKHIPVSLCPPQIHRRTALGANPACAVRNRRLTPVLWHVLSHHFQAVITTNRSRTVQTFPAIWHLLPTVWWLETNVWMSRKSRNPNFNTITFIKHPRL